MKINNSYGSNEDVKLGEMSNSKHCYRKCESVCHSKYKNAGHIVSIGTDMKNVFVMLIYFVKIRLLPKIYDTAL